MHIPKSGRGLILSDEFTSTCRRSGEAADGSPSLLLSGGNDCQVILWDWQTTQPQPPSSFQNLSLEDVQRPLIAKQWRLGRKVNCAILAGSKLVVADTSPVISLHNAGLAA